MASYLIKYILCSGALLAVYHLFLEREKMLYFNRFYLLAALVFPLIAPFGCVEVPAQTATALTGRQLSPPLARIVVPEEAAASANALHPAEAALTDYLPWLVYGLIAAALLVKTGVRIRAIWRIKRGCQVVPFHTAELVLVPHDTPTYTFFNAIFVPRTAWTDGNIPDEILLHELAHTQQKHSLDIVVTELLIALCWFNPLLLLYRRAIRLNHEYLADDTVLTGHNDVQAYQLLILDTLLAQRAVALTSSFNYPFTQKRLAMMTTPINRRIQFAKKAFIAMLLPMLALALAEKTYSQQPQASETKVAKAAPSGTNAVSEEEMKQFYATIEAHTKYVKNKKGRVDPIVTMLPELENELYAVYERMNTAQKADVKAKDLVLFKMDIPVKKAPTPEIFENWKRPEVFGIWINEKHVPNSELNKYKYSDIAEYDLSKLYGAALKGRSYKYQLDLTTNDYFDKTYDERLRNRVVITRMVRFVPVESSKKGK